MKTKQFQLWLCDCSISLFSTCHLKYIKKNIYSEQHVRKQWLDSYLFACCVNQRIKCVQISKIREWNWILMHRIYSLIYAPYIHIWNHLFGVTIVSFYHSRSFFFFFFFLSLFCKHSIWCTVHLSHSYFKWQTHTHIHSPNK